MADQILPRHLQLTQALLDQRAQLNDDIRRREQQGPAHGHGKGGSPGNPILKAMVVSPQQVRRLDGAAELARELGKSAAALTSRDVTRFLSSELGRAQLANANPNDLASRLATALTRLPTR
jgi:hypothetical protein